MLTIIILDGDELSYISAASSEERSIVVTHKESDRKKIFKNRTAFKEFLEGKRWGIEDFEIRDQQEPNDISHALSTLKRTIKNLQEKLGTDKTEIYLSAPDNFRLFLPLPERYKSNREGMIRPVHLDACKQYLIDRWGAKLSPSCEADDMLSIRAYDGYKNKQQVIAVSQDKDARMCTGWLYDPVKEIGPLFIDGFGKIEINSKGKVVAYGRLQLYLQLLIGDSSDLYCPRMFIQGTKPRFGEKAAYVILSKCTNDRECWEAIVRKYKEWFPERFQYTAWNGLVHTADWYVVLSLIADCAYMLKQIGVGFNLGNVLDYFEVEV